MLVTWRHLRFLGRWVAFYNMELVWLNWRLPRRISPAAALPADADERRRRAHLLLGEVTASGNRACVNCGRCCLETVDRFTPFDEIVRRQTAAPAPSASRRIYSVPWMIWNSIYHGFQRLNPAARHKPAPLCPHLTPEGCGLSRGERSMICVSWFCPTFVLAMDKESLKRAEKPLREIEALHREAVRAARK